MKTAYGFSRRGPDRVTEELTAVLSAKTWFEFKSLFELVYANLRARNAISGGEEMLRLRSYEKLQALVQSGVVKKDGKKYKGIPAALATYITAMNEATAAAAIARPPSVTPAAPARPAPARRAVAAAR